MAYTVRTNEEDEKAIKKAKELLETSSATKAMIESSRLLPLHLKKIEELEDELSKMESNYFNLAQAVKTKMEAENNLSSLCADVEVPYKYTY